MVFDDDLVSIDIDKESVSSFFAERNTPVICIDGLSPNHKCIDIHSTNHGWRFLFAKSGDSVLKLGFVEKNCTFKMLHEVIEKQNIRRIIDHQKKNKQGFDICYVSDLYRELGL